MKYLKKLLSVTALSFMIIGLAFQAFGMEEPDSDLRRTTVSSAPEKSKELEVQELLRRRVALEKGKQNLSSEEIILLLLQQEIRSLKKEADERESRLLARIESLEKEAAGRESRAVNKRQAREAEERKAEAERQFILTIPPVARDHVEIYQRFLKGVLVYRPNPGSEEGRIDLPIASLTNPLEGTFDLSRCGDADKYLSISTGYRKGKKAENANKLEIWLAPRFLVEKEIKGDARHLKAIFPSKWPEQAPVGIFWTWGSWDSVDCFDYLTTENLDELGNDNLYEKLESVGKFTYRSHHSKDFVRHVFGHMTTLTFEFQVRFLN